MYREKNARCLLIQRSLALVMRHLSVDKYQSNVQNLSKDNSGKLSIIKRLEPREFFQRRAPRNCCLGKRKIFIPREKFSSPRQWLRQNSSTWSNLVEFFSIQQNNFRNIVQQLQSSHPLHPPLYTHILHTHQSLSFYSTTTLLLEFDTSRYSK